jgi:hypothetical protein
VETGLSERDGGDGLELGPIWNVLGVSTPIVGVRPPTVGRGLESKELFTWMAVIVMTMTTYVLVRYEEKIEEQRQVGGTVAVFALVALAAAGVANIGAF